MVWQGKDGGWKMFDGRGQMEAEMMKDEGGMMSVGGEGFTAEAQRAQSLGDEEGPLPSEAT